MQIDIRQILAKYLKLDNTQLTDSECIVQLEYLIDLANKAEESGQEIMPDAMYDSLIAYLKVVKPESLLLKQIWSSDDKTVVFDEDIDKFLEEYPMLSIQTIKDITDDGVKSFKSKLQNLNLSSVVLNCSLKENGHGIRIVYKYGDLVKATSRGRSTNGRDLTKQLKLILGKSNPYLKQYSLIEFRGEVLLPQSNMDKAKQYNSSIKSPFSGVASMLRDSASVTETQLLKFVGYDVLTDDVQFTTLSEKFAFIQRVGMYVPGSAVITVNTADIENNFVSIVNQFAQHFANYDFYTDGVVVTIDNLDLFDKFGREDKSRCGNLALKIGRWKQDVYMGRVKAVKWKTGKSKFSPVVIVADVDTGEEGVLTVTGNTVKNVPFYAPIHLLNMKAYIGNIIYFKYGGEAGVVPCDINGIPIVNLV